MNAEAAATALAGFWEEVEEKGKKQKIMYS